MTLLGLRGDGEPANPDELYAPDIVAELGGQAPLRPICGRFVGRAAVLELQREMQIAFERIEERVVDMLIEGDVAMVRRMPTYRNRGTGAALTFCIIDRYVFRDGLLVEFFQLPDTVALARLYGTLGVVEAWGRDSDVEDSADAAPSPHQPS